MIDRRAFLSGLCLAAPALASSSTDGPLLMRDLYEKDLSFSARALAVEGTRIRVAGFMAPPLKADSRFFVLTKRPMSVCPFCETEAGWPADILAIYTKRVIDVVPFNVAIEATGVLRLGGYTDTETGFVSRVRLEDASYARS